MPGNIKEAAGWLGANKHRALMEGLPKTMLQFAIHSTNN